MGGSIVYHIKDLYFKILLRCPICHTDLSPKKQIGNKNKEIQSVEIESYKFSKMDKYVQKCPKCNFKMIYMNCIPEIKEVKEIKNLNKIAFDKNIIGVN